MAAESAVMDLVFSTEERNKTLAYMGGGALLGLLLLPRVPVVGPMLFYVAAPLGMAGGVAFRYGVIKKHVSDEGYGRRAALQEGAFERPSAQARSGDFDLRVVAGGAAVTDASL